MEARLANYDIENTTIDLIPTTEVDLAKLQKLEADLSGFKSIAEQLSVAKETKTQDELLIAQLQSRIDSIRADTIPFSKVTAELKAAFPNVAKVAFAEAKESDFAAVNDMPVLLLQWQRNTPISTRRREEPRIADFIKISIGLDTIQVVGY